MSAVRRLSAAALGSGAVLAGAVLLAPAQTVIAAGDPPGNSSAEVGPPPDPSDRAAAERGRRDKSTPVAGAPMRSERRAASRSHLERDRFMTELLAGREHTVLREGPWDRLDGSEIGTVMDIEFARPENISMRKWPSIRYDDATDSYATHAYNVEVRGATRLTLFIDADRGVVGAHADPGAVQVPGPGNERSAEWSTK